MSLNYNAMRLPELIEGNSHHDTRGSVRFVNRFTFQDVQRFYTIQPPLGTVRAWQGHLHESKWFYASKGSFVIQLVALNSEGMPEDKEDRKVYHLGDRESKILFIPGGYLNGFTALEEGSVLTIFSDFSLEQSKEDDIRVNLDALAW